MKIHDTPILIILLVNSLAVSPAFAAVANRQMWDQGGPACQLSVPTISSQVRPRATGLRNEGATNEFVICQYTATSAAFTQAGLYLVSIDGLTHAVQCTGMNGNISSGTRYSTKSATTNATPNYAVSIFWTLEDFGTGPKFDSFLFSVTCNLPAGTAIMSNYASYDEDVGE